MKYILICVLIQSTYGLIAQNQYFEGTILYDLEYQDRTGQMTDEQAKQYMGDEQKYSIKGNKYTSEMNGLLNMKQIYLGNDTMYTTMEGVNAILYIDAKENPDSILSYEIKDAEDKILGYNCRLLEIKSSEGLTKYYFSPDLIVNQKDYENHEYGYWKFSLEVTGGALPLKSVGDYKDLKLVTVAKSIEEKILNDSIFTIPPNLPILPSPEK